MNYYNNKPVRVRVLTDLGVITPTEEMELVMIGRTKEREDGSWFVYSDITPSVQKWTMTNVGGTVGERYKVLPFDTSTVFADVEIQPSCDADLDIKPEAEDPIADAFKAVKEQGEAKEMEKRTFLKRFQEIFNMGDVLKLRKLQAECKAATTAEEIYDATLRFLGKEVFYSTKLRREGLTWELEFEHDDSDNSVSLSVRVFKSNGKTKFNMFVVIKRDELNECFESLRKYFEMF